MKVYPDACCLSRLTDDQSQARVRRQAGAIETVLRQVRLGMVELVLSEALEDEARRNPSLQRRFEMEALLSMASITVQIDGAVAYRAQNLLSAGYGLFGALHLAAAESVLADALLTTDDRLIKRVMRRMGDVSIPVLNPVSWLEERGL